MVSILTRLSGVQDRNDLYVEADRTPGERVVEIDKRLAADRLLDDAGHPRAVRPGELDHPARLDHQARGKGVDRNPLHQLAAVAAKRLSGLEHESA